MEIHDVKNKKGENKENKMLLNPLSDLNPSVITPYWHTVTDALSDRQTYHKANKSLNHDSLTAS